MPYHVGKKGSSDCGGYPVVDDKGKVMGCHPTKNKAGRQVRALYAAGAAMKYTNNMNIEKSMVVEGDFVLATCEDETHVGIVQYVMTDGMFGIPGSEYAETATTENPVVLIRTLEYDEEDGWEESPYLIGSMAADVTKIPAINLEEKPMDSTSANAIKMLKQLVNELKKEDVISAPLEVMQTDTPNPGYQGCGCVTCVTLNCDCEHCPVCSAEGTTDMPDSEVAMAMYDSSIGKNTTIVDSIDKRDPSMKERERMAAAGTAMPDGSFPIANASDLRNAIQSVGRAKDYNAAKKHIITRARALGMIDALPEDWKNKVKKTDWGGSVFDLNPFVK